MSDERSDGPRLMTAKKHDGSKGAAWEKWKTEYLDAAAGKGDDMASWADTVNGTDQQVGLTAAHEHVLDARMQLYTERENGDADACGRASGR